MEYADFGDLYEKIQQHKKAGTFFEEDHIWKIFIQITRALKALHSLNIMHRDLKVNFLQMYQSANVFLWKDYTAKIGDMNVSKIARKDGLNYTQTGTPYYASPEVWRDESYDFKSDIWSLGCVLYEMAALNPPFNAPDMNSLFKKVTRGYFQRLPQHFSQELQNIVKYCLCVQANGRPSAQQILNTRAVQRKIQELELGIEEEEKASVLLKTIKNIKDIQKLKKSLPRPNFEPSVYFQQPLIQQYNTNIIINTSNPGRQKLFKNQSEARIPISVDQSMLHQRSQSQLEKADSPAERFSQNVSRIQAAQDISLKPTESLHQRLMERLEIQKQQIQQDRFRRQASQDYLSKANKCLPEINLKKPILHHYQCNIKRQQEILNEYNPSPNESFTQAQQIYQQSSQNRVPLSYLQNKESIKVNLGQERETDIIQSLKKLQLLKKREQNPQYFNNYIQSSPKDSPIIPKVIPKENIRIKDSVGDKPKFMMRNMSVQQLRRDVRNDQSLNTSINDQPQRLQSRQRSLKKIDNFEKMVSKIYELNNVPIMQRPHLKKLTLQDCSLDQIQAGVQKRVASNHVSLNNSLLEKPKISKY